jgi:2-oxoglutarate ferredoxin oxidoreductase subunit alpha
VPFTRSPNADGEYLPYLRNPETLARPWAIPGTSGLEHRLGGLEKEDVTGNVSYSPENHEKMVLLRERKIAGIADDIPPLEVDDPDGAATLVLGWGSTFSSIAAAVRMVRHAGGNVARAHLRYLNPFPRNLGEVLGSYRRVIIPEMNRGHLWRLVRADFLVDAIRVSQVRGMPFKAHDLRDTIMETIAS